MPAANFISTTATALERGSHQRSEAMAATYIPLCEIQVSSWQRVIPPHPAALLLPRMKAEAIQTLGEDIKANGQQTPIVILADAEGKRWLLDGISRLDAMVRVL
jgi:hypothetical protein